MALQLTSEAGGARDEWQLIVGENSAIVEPSATAFGSNLRQDD